jgi:pimeloyl-ACP methyl ester carboxylesterase
MSMLESTVTSFEIRVPDGKIRKIKSRLVDANWPKRSVSSWEYGTSVDAMRDLVDYWTSQYDWTKQEGRLNALPQFRATTADGALHFVHKKSGNPTALPVLLLHGWPSSFYEFYDVAEQISAGAGAPQNARDVVIASLPGFAFSEFASAHGPKAIASLLDQLMAQVLGYPRYLVHGGDWGALVATWLGLQYPEHCAGIHISMVSARIVGTLACTAEDQQWLSGFRARFEEDGAYFRLQSTRPLTINYALDDSPIGTAAWMLEKFAAWSDIERDANGPKLWSVYSRDQLLTNIMLYLISGSSGSAAWIFRAFAEEGPPDLSIGTRLEVPVGVIAMSDPAFPTPPRGLVERAYNVVHWGEPGNGGHFPGFEIPGWLSQDILEFASDRR